MEAATYRIGSNEAGAMPALAVIGEARRLDGERLALATTAAAVALLPLLKPGGPANTAPVDAFIALAVFSSLLWAGSSRLLLRAPYALAAGVIIAAGAAGALAGPVPSGGLVAVTQDIWVLALVICVANVCRTPQALRLILRTWVYSAIVWAALLLIGELAGISLFEGLHSETGGRTSLTFGDANIATHYFFISMMIVAATRYPPQRLVRMLVYALLLSAWALGGSNGGLVQLLVAVVLIGLFAIYRRSGAVPTIAVACCVLTAGAVAIPNIPFRRLQVAAHDSRYRIIRDWVGRGQASASVRKELVSESVGLYYHGSVPLGQGPTSTIHRLTTTQAPFAREAHDDYLAALVERGVLGALGVMLLLASVSARTWAVVRRPLSGGFAHVVPNTAPLLGAVVGTFLMATVYEVLHVRQVWALFGVVAALYLWGRK
jgi:hypothetical protein